MAPATEALVALAILETASEVGLLYFRLLEQARLTAEQKVVHYQETQRKYYASIGKPVPKPPEKKGRNTMSAKELPWWKKNVDEMLGMIVLGAIAWLALHYGKVEGLAVAGACAGGLVVYLGKGKPKD